MNGKKAPFRIGVCMEFAIGSRLIADFYDGIRLACAEALEGERIDRPVELVFREVRGPMLGTNQVVLDAWRELAYEEKVLAIIGPVVTEANLAIVDEVNRAEVPTISFCATLDWAGPYCFALPNGAFVDEAPLLAAYIAAEGHRTVGVFHEDGIIGEEFFAAFRRAARRLGVRIVSDHVVGLFNTQEPVDPQLEAVRESGPDCVLVLSAYGGLPPVQAAMKRAKQDHGFDPPRYQNMTWVALTAMGTTGDRPLASMLSDFEGWVGLDQIHERNETFRSMLDRFEKRYGRRPFHAYSALGYDHGNVVASALARMKPPSPKGFKAALERTRMLPACIGGPGTMISFGPYDHRGYKGDFIVFRTVRGGKEELVDVSWADLLKPRQAAETKGAEPKSEGRTTIPLLGERTPIRVGILQDWALWAPVGDWYKGLHLAFEEAYEEGLVDRRIETVLREVEGPPNGPAAAVIDAWRELAFDEKVIAIVGPHITDMNRIIRDEVERGRVPTISHCATVYFDGEYCFQAPNGTFADETYLIVKHLADRGARSVGVIREDNPIGDEYFDFFRQHARRLGLSLASDQIVRPVPTRDEMRAALSAIRASGAESIAHVGYGFSFDETQFVVHEMKTKEGWDPPRVTITTWVVYSGANHQRGSPRLLNLKIDPILLDGWVGVDLPHEGNPFFQAFLERYAKRYGGPAPFNCYPAHLYDFGRLLAEGIARARPLTPEGVKRGLEQVRMVPSTLGAPGTVMSLGPYDHRAYKGPGYLVLRTMRNGVEGLVETLGAGTRNASPDRNASP